jgi:hypothetical protein
MHLVPPDGFAAISLVEFSVWISGIGSLFGLAWLLNAFP